jgi:hypothetical protein
LRSWGDSSSMTARMPAIKRSMKICFFLGIRGLYTAGCASGISHHRRFVRRTNQRGTV